MNNLTERDIASMTAMKQMIDSYEALPLTVQLTIENRLDGAMADLNKVLKLYSTDVRNDITTAVNKAGINKRHFDLIGEESGEVVVL